MNQAQKAEQFAKLHVKGSPILLYNVWDAGSAKAVLDAGAKVIATSSWAVAEAHGYRDGEAIPMEFVEQVIARITRTIDAPVTVDFEGGYSEDETVLAQNVSRLLDLGVIGINFEDRVVQGSGLYSAEKQARRIAAIREAGEKKGIKLFINARTDVFFQKGDPAEFIQDALERGARYTSAGASGFFVPGLKEDALIERLCEALSLPVNVMVMGGVSPNKKLAELGVARISYGAIPHIETMNSLRKRAVDILAG